MSLLKEDEGKTTEEQQKVESVFKQLIGAADVGSIVEDVGNQTFLKFIVGQRAPIYERALYLTQRALKDDNPFRGFLALKIEPPETFPESLEARLLISVIARSTRHISEGKESTAITVPFVPFQNNEDEKAIQPATHLIVGRRGVGKSTLITRSIELLRNTPNVCVVMDMQAYSEIHDASLFPEVFFDLAVKLRAEFRKRVKKESLTNLDRFLDQIENGSIASDAAPVELKRIVAEVTEHLGASVFVFLDDFHLVERDLQPQLLNLLQGAMKGAGGWLKVTGLNSLLNAYDPKTRQGLQVPGDAQKISLDLTLVDPKTAEEHLKLILVSFLNLLGVNSLSAVMSDAPFQRLVWANAGVPRDFLQMFAKALEHARRSRRPKVTLTDTNLAIGEFGQQKMDELELDARNEKNVLRKLVDYLEKFCLEEKKVNAFLVRSEHSKERELVQILSDLRIVHLIHPTITPHRAGQRYEAYILDYSLFTGFRRRPNIKEMVPESGSQFKASDLRKIPALPTKFCDQLG